jgi:hypothetical protein
MRSGGAVALRRGVMFVEGLPLEVMARSASLCD